MFRDNLSQDIASDLYRKFVTQVAYDMLVAQGEGGKTEGDDSARLTEFVEQAKVRRVQSCRFFAV